MSAFLQLPSTTSVRLLVTSRVTAVGKRHVLGEIRDTITITIMVNQHGVNDHRQVRLLYQHKMLAWTIVMGNKLAPAGWAVIKDIDGNLVTISFDTVYPDLIATRAHANGYPNQHILAEIYRRRTSGTGAGKKGRGIGKEIIVDHLCGNHKGIRVLTPDRRGKITQTDYSGNTWDRGDCWSRLQDRSYRQRRATPGTGQADQEQAENHRKGLNAP